MNYDDDPDEDGTYEYHGEDDEFDENSDEPEDDGEDEFDTVPCPECGAEVFDDASQCPICGAYITHSTSQWHAKPLWWIVLGLAGIAAVLGSLVGLPWIGF